MRHNAFPAGVARESLIAWYRATRARTRDLFARIPPDAYYERPISLRNPIVFYEGHLPVFSVNTLVKMTLGGRGIDPHLETLFERGIDPESEAAVKNPTDAWPAREEVQAYGTAADALIERTFANEKVEDEEATFTIIEHELMHQETLCYMWHRLPYEQKRRPSMTDGRWPMTDVRGARSEVRRPALVSATIPAGSAVLGADRHVVPFGWDNEFDGHVINVAAFDIDTLPVTNAQFLEFVVTRNVEPPAFWLPADGSAIGHRSSAIEAWHWRAMFESEPLFPDWPVYVSQEDAAAYARWKGRRLMTEAEWHRAAEGATPGHVDFAGFDPIPVGSHPDTASVHGVHDLIGNGWEWTSTIFGPFAGFTAMRSYPEYSADFFDGQHYVMKGASPATARELIRPSFRNWFRGNYPYVYAKFRTVR